MLFTHDDARSLADKLASLDLNADEQAALHALLDAVVVDDVSGFGPDPGVAADRYANQEVSYLRGRLLDLLGTAQSPYIGETEKHTRPIRER